MSTMTLERSRSTFDVTRMLHGMVRTESRVPVALLRLSLAALFFPHGAQHFVGWFGGYGFAGTHQWMTETLGFAAPLATLAIVTEFVAPLALVAGIGGRIAALGLIGVMAGAISTHAENGFFMNWFGALPSGAEGFEYHLLVMAAALPIVLEGSGAWSIDRALTDRRFDGATRQCMTTRATSAGRRLLAGQRACGPPSSPAANVSRV